MEMTFPDFSYLDWENIDINNVDYFRSIIYGALERFYLVASFSRAVNFGDNDAMEACVNILNHFQKGCLPVTLYLEILISIFSRLSRYYLFYKDDLPSGTDNYDILSYTANVRDRFSNPFGFDKIYKGGVIQTCQTKEWLLLMRDFLVGLRYFKVRYYGRIYKYKQGGTKTVSSKDANIAYNTAERLLKTSYESTNEATSFQEGTSTAFFEVDVRIVSDVYDGYKNRGLFTTDNVVPYLVIPECYGEVAIYCYSDASNSDINELRAVGFNPSYFFIDPNSSNRYRLIKLERDAVSCRSTWGGATVPSTLPNLEKKPYADGSYGARSYVYVKHVPMFYIDGYSKGGFRIFREFMEKE